MSSRPAQLSIQQSIQIAIQPELVNASPLLRWDLLPGKLAMAVKAMGRRLLAERRLAFYPLAEARLPLAQRGKSGLPIEAAICSYFSTITGCDDLQSVLDRLTGSIRREQGGPRVQLPDGLMAELFAGYCVRRAPDLFKGKSVCYDANRWLTSRIATLRRVQQAIPEPIERLRRKESRELLAADYGERVLRLFNVATDYADRPVSALHLWRLCGQPLQAWGMLPKLPAFQSEESRDRFIATHLARWLDAKWWARRLRKIWDQYGEHCAILLGQVRRGASPYVSCQGLRAFLERQQEAAAWLRDMEAYNAEADITLDLTEAVAASVANPANRRHELVVRARGFSDVADELGFVGLFFTWTAPSRFHPWKTHKQAPDQPERASENPKYQGQSPRDTQAYITELWQRCRAALARAKTPTGEADPIHYFGFRVVEPHHDGTPHWHLLLWVRPEHQHRLIGILQRYALSHNQDDLQRSRHPDSKRPYSDITPRFDWKVMDKEKGGAVGYIVKYIAKNIDGHRVGEQGDLEAETAASEGARRVRAWASLWGLRQFQALGGPSVGIWRELRKLPGRRQTERGAVVAPLPHPIIEECRRYADATDWAPFTQAMGGPCCPRSDRPLKLHHITRDTPNQYGETVNKLLGVQASDGVIQATRAGEWVLRKRGSGKDCEAGKNQRTAVALGERSELAVDERSEGLSLLGALTITVRGAQSVKNACSTGNKLVAHLGLDGDEIALIERGAVVKSGDRYYCIRDNQLKVTPRHPFEPPDGPTPFQIETDAELREQQRGVALAEIRGLLAGSGDAAAWLASMTAAGAADALALQEALEAGDEEQVAARLRQLQDRVNMAHWPEPPREERADRQTDAEFFGEWESRWQDEDDDSATAPYQPSPQEQARADRMKESNDRHAAEIAQAQMRRVLFERNPE